MLVASQHARLSAAKAAKCRGCSDIGPAPDGNTATNHTVSASPWPVSCLDMHSFASPYVKFMPQRLLSQKARSRACNRSIHLCPGTKSAMTGLVPEHNPFISRPGCDCRA